VRFVTVLVVLAAIVSLALSWTAAASASTASRGSGDLNTRKEVHHLVLALDGGLGVSAHSYPRVDAVKTHLKVLFEKFDLADVPRAHKRAELARRALDWGLVSSRDLR